MSTRSQTEIVRQALKRLRILRAAMLSNDCTTEPIVNEDAIVDDIEALLRTLLK